jgi:hypothetical protein
VAELEVTAYTDDSSAPVSGTVTTVVAGIGRPVLLVTPEPPIHAAALEYTSAAHGDVKGSGLEHISTNSTRPKSGVPRVRFAQISGSGYEKLRNNGMKGATNDWT